MDLVSLPCRATVRCELLFLLLECPVVIVVMHKGPSLFPAGLASRLLAPVRFQQAVYVLSAEVRRV